MEAPTSKEIDTDTWTNSITPLDGAREDDEHRDRLEMQQILGMNLKLIRVIKF